MYPLSSPLNRDDERSLDFGCLLRKTTSPGTVYTGAATHDGWETVEINSGRTCEWDFHQSKQEAPGAATSLKRRRHRDSRDSGLVGPFLAKEKEVGRRLTLSQRLVTACNLPPPTRHDVS